jgi:hypothetical protein
MQDIDFNILLKDFKDNDGKVSYDTMGKLFTLAVVGKILINDPNVADDCKGRAFLDSLKIVVGILESMQSL